MHTLFYSLIYSKWDNNLPNEHHARLETGNWEHELIRKPFADATNKVRNTVIFSQAYIHSDFIYI